jgi:DNA helicase-2/ATP-dependent DNA helicase PcrA
MPGPAALGRGVIVDDGADAPEPWAGAPRVVVDDAVLRDPAGTIETLHEAWQQRHPIVVELRVPVEELRTPEHELRAPHALTPSFTFTRELLYFLVRANSYDARRANGRDGTPRWWPVTEAERLGARPGTTTDLVLPDGTEAWCDGGPRAPAPVPVVHRSSLEAGACRPDGFAQHAAEGLAPDQRAAVLHAGGPARVLAPAGSGKTTVLTARLRHLVGDRGYALAHVTALAYNRRAGDELRARLADLPAALGQVRTLNSFGYDVLRRAAARPVDVLDEREVRDLLAALLRAAGHETRRRANTDPLAAYLEALEEVQLGLVAPERVEAARDDVPGLAAIFPEYRRRLAARGATDFDGQVYGALEALLTDPVLRAEVQRSCRHLLVDELQDLRPAHLLMIRLAAAPAFDVFGVGDDDQVIYGYAHADPAFLLDYHGFFPGAASYLLGVNYRCPPAVVRGAVNLLGRNRRRVPKEIRAARTDDSPLALVITRVPAVTLPAEALARVRSWLDGGREPRSVAVLHRVNAGLLPVQVLAQDAGIPVTPAVDARWLRRTGVAATLAAVRLACAAAGGQRWAGADLADVGARRSDRVTSRVRDWLRERRAWTPAEVRKLAGRVRGPDAERIEQLAGDIERWGAAVRDGEELAGLLDRIRADTGFATALTTLDRAGKGRDASHLDDLDALQALAPSHPRPATFEAWLREHLRAPAADEPEATGRVTLSTIHRVKGMEWDHVAVLGMHDGQMPHRLADDHEEERRLAHVAITRGRVEVVVLAASDAAAPFVDEIEGREGPEPPPPSRPSPRDPAPRPPVAPGDAALRETLREWRRSAAAGKPAYTVFTDRTLDAIVARRPGTLEELARVPGIGLAKLERYGDAILGIVADHPADANDPTDD